MPRERRLSRRQVLTATGAAGIAFTTGSVPAAAQDDADITTLAVIPDVDAFEKSDYTGFFVQLTDMGDEAAASDEIANCTFRGFTPDNTDGFEAQLVDRAGDDTRSVRTKLYARGETVLETGSVFVVNQQFDCPDGYVGVELERVMPDGVTPNFGQQSGGSDDASPVSGPGFGPAAGVAGVALGALGLLRRRSGDD